jgi:citrate synthase
MAFVPFGSSWLRTLGESVMMREAEPWSTKLTNARPNHTSVRGYAIDEMMGRLSFAESVYLLFRGELPPPAIRPLLEAILVASLDHGPTSPSASVARLAASTGAPLNGALAGGLTAINRFHGGAIEPCMELLQQGVADATRLGLSADDAAASLVNAALAAKKTLPGFGHRVHTRDPRTVRLFALAREAGLDGEHVAMARSVQKALAAAGKDLPINVDGGIAAMLCELGFPPALGNVFFMVGRLPGMAAQAYEESTTQKPMRRIDFQACRYDGPADRSLPA